MRMLVVLLLVLLKLLVGKLMLRWRMHMGQGRQMGFGGARYGEILVRYHSSPNEALLVSVSLVFPSLLLLVVFENIL